MSAAFAEAHTKGNSGLAQAMKEAITGGLATAGGAVNPDKNNSGKGTASDISGQPNGGGNGGWGNIGSFAVGGGQVSNRGGTRGAKAD